MSAGMSTIAIIFRTEARRMLRGRWLPALWLVFAVLCGWAARDGAAWVAQREAALAAILDDERATHALRRAQIADKVTPENRGFYGGALYATAMSLRATLPPGELAVLTVGQAEGYPMAATVFPFAASNTIFDKHVAGMENPNVLAAGRFDLAFVMVWLLPLLVLAGSFDLWSSERERGMAPWLLSQPVAPLRLLLAKAAARALLLVAPPVAILLVTLGAAMDWRGPGAAPWPALLVLGALVLLYGLFWLALALVVNLFARGGAQAALGCLAGWLVLVVLLPALALALADLAAPPASQAERVNALRAQAMLARAELRAQAQASPVPEPDPALAPAIPDSLRHRAAEVARGEVLIAAAQQPFRRQDARRHAWLDALRAVSPAVALQDALERLAGADAARALRFQDQAHGFLLEVRVLVGRYLDQDRLLGVADYDRGLPRFTFREASAPERAASLLFDGAVIAAALAALLAVAGVLARRRLLLID